MSAYTPKQSLDLQMFADLPSRAPKQGSTIGLWTTLKNLAAAVLAYPQRRAVLRELTLLTDRELADIGLARAELHRVFEPQFIRARGR